MKKLTPTNTTPYTHKAYLILVMLILNTFLSAQYHFSFTHYTSDNGLSQNGITAMMKDSKGYLWVGTRDGLNKFDGYNFTIFNSKPNQNFSLLSNRILLIKEDQWGYIWVKTYDDIVYRLNPSTEKLNRIELPNGTYVNDKIDDIVLLPSGTIWLKTYSNGSYKVTVNPENQKLTVEAQNVQNKKLPHNKVTNIFEDSEQNTWVLTLGGLVCIDAAGKALNYYPNLPFYSYNQNDKRLLFGAKSKLIQWDKRYKNFKIKELEIPVEISTIKAFSPNNYIFATLGKGFYTFDIVSDELTSYSVEKYPDMKTNNIQEIFIDRAGDAWLGIHFPGVLHFKLQTNKVQYIPSIINEGQVTNPNYLIFEDEKDVLWVQPYFGSFSWYDRQKNRLVPFYSAYNEDVNTLFSYGVNHVLSDTQGVLWVSTNRGNGFFKCTFLPDYFNHYLFQDHSVYSISNETRAIFEDNEKRLWVACKDGSVHVFDENKREIGTMGANGKISNGAKIDVLVYNFFQDDKNNIWFATKRQGLFRLKPTGKNTFSIENFLQNASDKYSPASNDFYSITQDAQHRIWAGSYGGGLHLIEEKDAKVRFIHAKNELSTYPIANCSKVRQVFVDSKQNMWVATTEGFVTFDTKFNNPSEIKFNYFQKKVNQNSSLGANDVHCIYEDTEGDIWFGTFGGGLNKLTQKNTVNKTFGFEVYDRIKGMPNNIIYAILDDKQGNLWLTTENSIVRMNKKTQKIDVFGKGNELENVEFSEASACLLQSGEICVGAKSGFYYFRPEAVKRRVINAPLVFTNLMLFNKPVEVGGEESVLQTQLDNSTEIELNHKQNVFTIEFATLDMRAPEKIQYAYKLDGFDEDWNNVGTKHFATYTALQPGKYTFRVKSTDSEGIWLDKERQLEVSILPTFWQSSFATFLYVIFAIMLIMMGFYVFMTFYKLKNNVNIEKQLTDMKLRFFTDISHELRTPLTLISLPVDNILKENIDPNIREQLTLARRNLDRVMSLINQILDFRKVQNNKMHLTVEEIPFGEFVKTKSTNFVEIAHNKDIKFDIIDNTQGAKVWLDPERFESIIYNLLSNAFKFTPSGKKITIQTDIKQNVAIFSVSDEGIGIAQEKINFIFDRFFSIPSIKNITQKSTGIGLDLVKKLVDLHHATIGVESQLGKGSTFQVEFQLGVSHFDKDVDILLSDDTIPGEEEIESNLELSNLDSEKRTVLPLILLVEDNDELRHFLKNSLNTDYRVEEAENGLVGWKKIERNMPDFIITDLLMPEMDGLELTQKVKDDSRTSHIPVILLTAVTDIESKVTGMKIGVDDYITKPFSSDFLHARIENLINQRRQLQKHYRHQIRGSSKPDFSLPPLEIASQDEIFMQKLLKLMHENVDNFELNIDFLSSELGMSRTVFFNKLKSLTGLSPVEFVREVRFERAAEYIKTSQLSVSEISYKVGIEDPRYFSRCFKQKFGLTPSEYRQKESKG